MKLASAPCDCGEPVLVGLGVAFETSGNQAGGNRSPPQGVGETGSRTLRLMTAVYFRRRSSVLTFAALHARGCGSPSLTPVNDPYRDGLGGPGKGFGRQS